MVSITTNVTKGKANGRAYVSGAAIASLIAEGQCSGVSTSDENSETKDDNEEIWDEGKYKRLFFNAPQ